MCPPSDTRRGCGGHAVPHTSPVADDDGGDLHVLISCMQRRGVPADQARNRDPCRSARSRRPLPALPSPPTPGGLARPCDSPYRGPRCGICICCLLSVVISVAVPGLAMPLAQCMHRHLLPPQLRRVPSQTTSHPPCHVIPPALACIWPTQIMNARRSHRRTAPRRPPVIIPT